MGAFLAGVEFLAWERIVNTASHTARTGTVGLIVGVGTLGAVVATWRYLPGDGLAFKMGHGIKCCEWIWGFVMCFDDRVCEMGELGEDEGGKIDYRLEKFDTDDEASGVLGGFTSGVRSIY